MLFVEHAQRERTGCRRVLISAELQQALDSDLCSVLRRCCTDVSARESSETVGDNAHSERGLEQKMR